MLLLANAGSSHNRLKIYATIQNAKTFQMVQEEFDSIDAYLVDGKPIIGPCQSIKEVPSPTEISEAMSKDLRQRGFKSVGSTICYVNMPAVGRVNDHLITCFRHKQLS